MELLFSSGSMVYTGNTFSGVYGIQCHETGKWYVGESKNVIKRQSAYIRGCNKKQLLIYNAINKYGIGSFSSYKLEECPQNVLHEREIYWGKQLNSLDPAGYNLRLGGNGKRVISEITRSKLIANGTGRKHSAETKIKMKKSWITRKPVTLATKQKLSDAGIGRVYSQESRDKKRQKMLGRTFSPETIKKMSIAAENRCRITKLIKWLEQEAPWFVPQELQETSI